MDGVNNNVIGYIILIISSIIFIETKNDNFQNFEIYNFFLISLIVFYLFNLFDKNYLGDSGIYILSLYLSVLIISYVNKTEYISPLLAVSFLWYPALETLFSIVRKLSNKKNPFKPDTLHLHTLILKLFSYYKIKYPNTLSGVSLNLILIPNFLIAVNYYNHSIILAVSSILYVLLYLFFYYSLSQTFKN